MTEFLKQAKEYFYNKEYNKALEIFIKKDNYYEAGLCCLLLKDEANAKKYWDKNKKGCLGCSWGLAVLKLINLKLDTKTTFFQTRAFLEVYLNLFLENNLIEWAQNMVSCCDFFYTANPESYKFIARALFANGYFDLAAKFCKKSLQIFYCDPEALLILAQCQYLLGDVGNSLDSINRTLNMVDDYFPAKLFKKILLQEIEKRRKKPN